MSDDQALPGEERYQVERELGRGGMAVVYLAIDRKQNRRVALKVLRPEVAAAVGFDRFQREVEFAAQLSHPHLLPLFDTGLTAGPNPRPYYVMPYVEGKSLRELLVRERQIPVGDAVRIAREVAGALAYAHGQGVIHRDIKPENILLSSGSAVVADFGIARALDCAADPRLTGTGVALGTPHYMSPEQALGERTVDGRTDVYALGAVLYEMLAGEPPYGGPTAQAVVARALAEPVPSLLGVRRISPALDAIVRKALEKAPADRYRNAEALAEALATVASAPAGPGRDRRPRPLARWLVGLVAAGLVVALGARAFQRLTRESTLDAALLAIVPFDGAAIPLDLHVWREGITDVLSRNLDGAGPLRTVTPTRVVRLWRGTGDRAAAREIARRTGAGLAVYGRIVDRKPDSVGVEASVLDVAGDRILAEVEVRGRADRMDRVSDSLTVALIRELGRTRAVGSGRLASVGSRSLPAIRAFLHGEAFFRRTAWDSAASHYRRAIELDSTFALATLRAGQVLGWQRLAQDQLSHEYLLQAGRLNHGLAPRDSLLILADSLFAALYGVDDPLENWRMTHRLTALLRDASERSPMTPTCGTGLGRPDSTGGSTSSAAPRKPWPPSSGRSPWIRRLVLPTST